MESRIFAGICGDFSSTNSLWRNRGEVERFFAGGMVERLWSGNEKLVEKSVENPADAGNGFHSLWKHLCTGLHRRFHSGRRRIWEISCDGEIFSPHGFSTACGKRCGKPEIFCGEAVESQDFQRNPTFPQETPDRKSGREKGSVVELFLYQAAPAERSWRDFRACFASVRTHLACIFSEIFQENTRKSTKDFLRFSFHLSKNLTAQSAYAQMQNRLSQRARSLLSRCPQTAKLSALCFWRAEKGTKSDSFLRGANKTAPRVKPERKGLIFAMSRWDIANGFPAAQKTACNPL